DLAAPGTGFLPARLDELAEPLQVTLDPPANQAGLVSDLLGHALGVHLQLCGDPGVVGVDAVERHHAALPGTAGGGPRHPLVGQLLGDPGVELSAYPADLYDPVRRGVVELADLLDAGHEAGEVLELRPLVVRGPNRYGNVDRFGRAGHGISPFVWAPRPGVPQRSCRDTPCPGWNSSSTGSTSATSGSAGTRSSARPPPPTCPRPRSARWTRSLTGSTRSTRSSRRSRCCPRTSRTGSPNRASRPAPRSRRWGS